MNIAKYYAEFLQFIGVDASEALLHVHAGMAVLLAARLITGRSLATSVPFAAVCIAQLANEVLDRITHGSWRWWDTSADTLNTLFWPFILVVGLRVRRSQESKREMELMKQTLPD